MSTLPLLRPSRYQRVMDLLERAGVDVSDWPNYADAGAGPAANPRYCYEWAFVEPDRMVVLNVWYQDVVELDGVLTLSDNLREAAAHHARGLTPGSATWRKRAERFDLAVQIADRERLPVRLIVCDGRKRRLGEDLASRVRARELDPEAWSVTRYDRGTGAFTLTRSVSPDGFVDQFSSGAPDDGPTETRSVSGTVFVRNPSVRLSVLRRASGICEWCRHPGFKTAAGQIFLETHHIVPLSEGGMDRIENVAALCPNHHREAHFGAQRDAMREQLLDLVRQTVGHAHDRASGCT